MIKYIDFGVQTLLVLIGATIAVSSLFYKDIIGLIGIDQFFLGVWQIAGCVTYMTIDPENNNYRTRYLQISGIYILSLLTIGSFLNDFSEIAMGVYLIVPSWVLGIYYYLITVKTTFPKTGSGRFLPHLSF